MITLLQKLVEDGIVTLRSHPKHPNIQVCNYTTKTQIERLWNKYTIQCRGLIVDKNHIIARPFKKFFNYDELGGLCDSLWELYSINYSDIWNLPFIASEKCDGSLAIFFYMDEWEWSTRGSFESEQAELARQVWRDKYNSIELDKRYTYLFEIVGPTNRIVLKYDESELYLLGIIETYTGIELSYDDITKLGLPFPQPKVYRNIDAIIKAESTVNDQFWEGYVLDFGGGFRCKMKANRYKEIHRIVTNLTPKRVLEAIQNGSIDTFFDIVPDEFHHDIIEMKNSFIQQFNIIDMQVKVDFNKIYNDSISRKDFAALTKYTKYPHLMFALYDKKSIDDLIWRLL